jgi:plastocyanin
MENNFKNQKGNTAVIVVVIIALLAVAVYLLMGDNETAVTVTPSPEVSVELSPSPSPLLSVTPTSSSTPKTSPVVSAVKTFTISAENFSFDLKEMKVKKGDTVKVIFKNMEGTHDWVIDQFNARTKKIGVGQIETIQFVADKSGTFEYYCSVGTHRQMGMKGNLIVE